MQRTLPLYIGAFAFLLGLVLVSGVLAQTSDIPSHLQGMAEELGCTTRAECEAVFEHQFEKGIELAEKYNVYTDPTQRALAETYKKEIITKLSDVEGANLEEEILKIAKDIVARNKTLAKQLGVTSESVKTAETVVTTRTENTNRVLGLEEALKRGDYPGLGQTAEEAGLKCLRAGSESLTTCDAIARTFFGEEGVQELARARQGVREQEDFYKQGIQNLSLRAPSGEIVVGKEAIRGACDSAFQNKDVTYARACGDFAVKNGFARQEEVDRGLTLLQSVTAVSEVNITSCSENPESCKNYIPDDYRREYEAKKKIYETISREAGLRPEDCRRAPFDSEIGRKCVEASKRIAPTLRSIAGDLPEAERLVGEIEIRTQRGDEYTRRASEFTSVLQSEGGPGGCRSESECAKYCSDPKNGAECISFGAKFQVFQGDEAIERYAEYNKKYTTPTREPVPGDRRGAYPYPYPDPNRPIAEPYYPPTYSPTPGYPGGGVSPECYAAIQSGDFVKAKSVCNVTKPYPPYPPQPIVPPEPICQLQIDPPNCAEGSYSETRYENGCPAYGKCVPIPGYQQKPQPKKTTWYFKDGGYESSYIFNRSDREYLDYISSIGVQCRAISKSKFVWRSGAGNDAADNWRNFGIPDCSGSGAVEPVVEPYPGGDQNSCPGFAYSRWGSSGTRYCQLNAERKCNFFYPSYLTVSNYTAENCPTSDDIYRTSTSTEYSSCSASLKSLLGPDCHYMQNNSSGSRVYCDGPMTKSAKDGDTATTVGCTSNYTGDTNACPSFAFSKWDSTGKRYCQLNTEYRCDFNYPSYLTNGANYKAENCPSDYQVSTSTVGTSSCSASLKSLLGPDCHYMNSDASGNKVYCDGPMTKSAKDGDTATTAGCASSYTSQTTTSTTWQGTQCDWATQYLKDSTKTCLPKTNCSDSSNAEYNTEECRGVRNTTIVQTNTTTSNAVSTTPVAPTSTSSTSTSCTQAQIDELGSGCHSMGNATFDGTMTRYVLSGERYAKQCYNNYISNCTTGAPTTGTCPSGQTWYTPSGGGAGYCVTSTQTTTNTTTNTQTTSTSTTSNNYGACGSYTTQGTCTSGTNCYWFTASNPSSSYCYYSSTGGGGASATGGTTSSCSSSLIALLGSGCHYMHTDSSARTIYCNSEMTQSAKEGDTSVTQGCSSGGSTTTGSYGSSCPTTQYWNGSACVNNSSTSCPSGQWWNGTSCVTSTSTTCPSGQYWSGTACVNTSTTDCPTGQYWNGTACATTSSSVNRLYLFAQINHILYQVLNAIRGLGQ